MIGGMTGLFANKNSPITLNEEVRSRSAQEQATKLAKIFISYSHQDQDVAFKLRRSLEEEGFRVLIDIEALPPGKSIEAFIAESVKAADATVSIVSKYSLMSTWVALESEETLRHNNENFFGCYVDMEFLRREFVDEALESSTAQMREIGSRIKRRIDQDLGFEDLYSDYERYRRLRANIGKIVAQLRGTACLNMQKEVFAESCKKLANALRRL